MDADELFFVFVFWSVIGAVIGGVIGATRENGAGGAVLGFLLGPVGWLLTLFLDHRPQCPQCLGRIPVGAKLCLHCGSPAPSKPALKTDAPFQRTLEKPNYKCPVCDFTVFAAMRDARNGLICPKCQTGFIPPN